MATVQTMPGSPEKSRASKTSLGKSRTGRGSSSLAAHGEPIVWMTAGALALALAMIACLLLLVIVNGMATFWPSQVVQLQGKQGTVYLGEVADQETFTPTDADLEAMPAEIANTVRPQLAAGVTEFKRRKLRTENFELSGTHYQWVEDYLIAEESLPEWAMTVERLSGGEFYGILQSWNVDGQPAGTSPQEAWQLFSDQHAAILDRVQETNDLLTNQMGDQHAEIEAGRIALRQAELEHGANSVEFQAAQVAATNATHQAEARLAELQQKVDSYTAENDRYSVVLQTSDGQTVALPAANIVRMFPPNRMSGPQKVGVYLSRWGEFLLANPREANTEGGVYPAIFGTVVMTLLMSVAVVPFGVLAALYLREYAKGGWIVSLIRISINNLAGVPSIVFGVFGLGFFCYFLGGAIDRQFFEANLPSPTFGTGGVLWASLTLALLTVPVVIVATEEALSAVPNSMREGSYACGASKWQTIRRIVLPRALPGIMTGMILAIARGAGEVAPLMLVGAMQDAKSLVLDGDFPFFHPQRGFMHLGFHIYQQQFQSQNSEAAVPIVFTSTLLLIVIIATLNITAIWLRGRLRKKFHSSSI